LWWLVDTFMSVVPKLEQTRTYIELFVMVGGDHYIIEVPKLETNTNTYGLGLTRGIICG